MPLAWILAAVLLLAYVIEGFIADSILGDPETAPRSLLGISIQFAIVTIILRLRGYGVRLAQTWAALAGTGLLFGLLSVLLLLTAVPDRNQPLLALVWLAAFIWSLTVDAHIYRHALSTRWSQGILLAILIYGANFMAAQWVFGE
jgi:hypothetical protein